jgi:hypothetical protein
LFYCIVENKTGGFKLAIKLKGIPPCLMSVNVAPKDESRDLPQNSSSPSVFLSRLLCVCLKEGFNCAQIQKPLFRRI